MRERWGGEIVISRGQSHHFANLPGCVAILDGELLGLVTYATYDLTNMATVKDWPWIVTVVDLAWGAVLSTSVSCIAYFAGRWLR